MQFKHQQDTHAITQYIKFCEKQRFNHLSESTLYQILKGLKPSQRKIFAKLDDITTEKLNKLTILGKH